MAARGGRKIDEGITRKAAALHLDEELSIPALMERFGISRGSISTAVYKLRLERGVLARPATPPKKHDPRAHARAHAWLGFMPRGQKGSR